MLTATALSAALSAASYDADAATAQAVAAVLAGRGVRALLVEGPPGAGKSALAEATASVAGAALVVYQCHAWTGADELLVGVSVRAAVAGRADAVDEPGALLRAAQLAEEGPVVLLLDELDKASERAEAVLLDALQSGRIALRPGVQVRFDVARLIVVATSNGARPHSDALLRRCRRLVLGAPDEARAVAILGRMVPDPAGVRRLAVRLCRAVEPEVSVQEVARFLDECRIVSDATGVRVALAGWAARDEAGRKRAAKADVSALWGEMQTARRVP